MNRNSLSLGAALVALLAQVAPAQTQTQTLCFNGSVPSATTNWINSITIPKFDSALGVLQQIQFTLSATATGLAKAESLDAAPSIVTLNFQSTLTLTRPDNSVIVVTIPLQTFIDNFTAFDGTIDFGGTSGATHSNIVATASNSAISPPPISDLVLFTGPAHAPGTITLPITAVGTSTASGAGNLITQFGQQASAMANVCYIYIPRLESFCDGDGSGNGGIDCPCSNNAPPGQNGGCLNPTGQGALLTATGEPLIPNDTVHLTLTQVPLGAQAWFFEALQYSGGVIAGHGVSCLRGPIIRVQKVAVGGNVLPPPSGPALHVIIGALPGQITYFQGFYRALNDLCAAPLNTSNAIQIIWGIG